MFSPIDKLKKYLTLEAERGYDNRAIVGGLDKILPAWEQDARKGSLDEAFIRQVHEQIQKYPSLEPENRAALVRELLAHIPTNRRPQTNPQPNRQQNQHTQGHRPVVEERRHQPEPQPSHPVAPRPPVQQSRPQTVEDQPALNVPLSSPLTVVNGIGAKTAQMFATLGVNTLEELLYFFPRRYDDYSKFKPINRLEFGEVLTVIATVQSCHVRPYRGKHMMTEAIVSDGTGSLRLTWFNNQYIAKELTTGSQWVISGKVIMYLGRFGMNQPEIEQVEENHLHTNRIVPIYPLTEGLRQRRVRDLVHTPVSYLAPRVPDFLPSSIRTSAGLVNLSTALSQIHFPDSVEELSAARARLAFDEIFLLQLGVLRQKMAWQQQSAQVFEASDEWLQQQIARLPFELTNAQQKVLADVRRDLASGQPMNRLIQGDVGSGKTVIAALAASIIMKNGAQAAVLAPTSILAEQHYRTLSRLLTCESDDDAVRPEQISLLLGETPEAEKQAIRAGLANGEIRLVIGTHALLEDPIAFQRLQLAVIDEQHRFGVAQRSALRMKGENPHLMVMTATPIPRSLALTLYGDLDLSVMDELPSGRQPVATHVLRPVERERCYHFIRSQVEEGHQAFIIYPLVEQGDREAGQAAVEEHARLSKEVFPHLQIGLLHGRLKPEEKEQVMTAFRAGEYHILVSTTVVEVGVDVPNATVMLIEGANRFGLAQLHQLRGRVGRGDQKSYCLLVPENEDATENERLQVMAQTNDGFVLAEKDLEQRGPGDFLGTRQAGFADLHLANITDVRLIEKARNLAQQLFEQDPQLSSDQYRPLLQKLEQFWQTGQGDIS